jgi:hypothetical protein
MRTALHPEMQPFGQCDTTTGCLVVNGTACADACTMGGDTWSCMGSECGPEFAVCDGTTFSTCSCCIPPGYTLITNATGIPSKSLPAGDAGTVDASACTGKSTADSGRAG